MNTAKSSATRFGEFRERAGLSHDQVDAQMGIGSSSVWDIESIEGELSSVYSPSDIQKFSKILGIRPIELFGADVSESPISAVELVHLVFEQCRLQEISLERLENLVGWRLSVCIEPPERLSEDISVDGLQWLCQELGVDWHRVILSL